MDVDVAEGQLEEGLQTASGAVDTLLSDQTMIILAIIVLLFVGLKWLRQQAKERQELEAELSKQYEEMNDRLYQAGYDTDGNYLGPEEDLMRPFERRPDDGGNPSRMRNSRISSRHTESGMQYRNDLHRYTNDIDEEE